MRRGRTKAQTTSTSKKNVRKKLSNLSMMLGHNMRRLSSMCRHDIRLLAGYCCQISVTNGMFLQEGLGDYGPIPGVGFSVKIIAKVGWKR